MPTLNCSASANQTYRKAVEDTALQTLREFIHRFRTGRSLWSASVFRRFRQSGLPGPIVSIVAEPEFHCFSALWTTLSSPMLCRREPLDQTGAVGRCGGRWITVVGLGGEGLSDRSSAGTSQRTGENIKCKKS